MLAGASRRAVDDRGVSWFTALFAAIWLIAAWRLQACFAGLYFMAEVFAAGHPAEEARVVMTNDVMLVADPVQNGMLPPQESFTTHFFVEAQWPTVTFAAMILAKDLYLAGARRTRWNWILAAVALVLLINGWVDYTNHTFGYGIVF